MKCVTVAGPPSSGKTSILLKAAAVLAGRGQRLGVVKFDCLASRDREAFAAAGVPAVVGLSGALCPDHFYVCNAADAFAWGARQGLWGSGAGLILPRIVAKGLSWPCCAIVVPGGSWGLAAACVTVVFCPQRSAVAERPTAIPHSPRAVFF